MRSVSLTVATPAALLIARGRSSWIVEEHLQGLSPDCVAADPDNATCVYCGTARHGCFRSRDCGQTWQPVGPGIDHAAITAVAVGHAGRPGGFGVVFVGTEPSAVFRSAT